MSIRDSLKPRPVGGNYNFTAKTCFIVNPCARLSWFLIASYCYYQQDYSILTDDLFDTIVAWLRENLDKIDHPHKALVDQEMLAAGTAFNITAYPTIVRNCGNELIYGLRTSTE